MDIKQKFITEYLIQGIALESITKENFEINRNGIVIEVYKKITDKKYYKPLKI